MAICHPFLVQRSRGGPSRRCSHHVKTNGHVGNGVGGGGKRGLVQTTKSGSTLIGSGGGAAMLKKRTCHYLLPAVFFSVLVNIPKFFEFKTTVVPNKSTDE